MATAVRRPRLRCKIIVRRNLRRLTGAFLRRQAITLHLHREAIQAAVRRGLLPAPPRTVAAAVVAARTAVEAVVVEAAATAAAEAVAAEATTETFLLTQAYANVTRYCTPAQRSAAQTRHLTVS